MTRDERAPIIVGIGECINRSLQLDDALEPAELIVHAIRRALLDTGLETPRLQELESCIDCIDIVKTWTWPYDDLPGIIATRIGVQPKVSSYSEHGGHYPCRFLDEASRRVASGEIEVALVAGGEALASLSKFTDANKVPPPAWTKVTEKVQAVIKATRKRVGSTPGALHGMGNPVQIYPLFEAGNRAYRRQKTKANNEESAQLYADFARVASRHPCAWRHGQTTETAQSIESITPRNRMICAPYRLLMNAFNNVNLAGAYIVTSVACAEKLGIERCKWIYVLGGAGTSDHPDFWLRPNFYSSPAMERALGAALRVSELGTEQIDLFDFYSCFPIVPKLAAAYLNLPLTGSPKSLTLLGGLTSFGGAGNNYSTHAIVEMARQLRSGGGRYGLVLANGGHMTHQHAVCLSTAPRHGSTPYPSAAPLPQVVDDIPIPPIEINPVGEAVIETFTVQFKRNGTLEQAYIIGRMKANGHRFVANEGELATMQQLASSDEEHIGRSGMVYGDPSGSGRNLFTLFRSAKL